MSKPPHGIPFVPKYVQQNEEGEENHSELFPSLPKERGWIAAQMYKYNGFWHTAVHLQGTLSCQQHFKAVDGDIFLVTTPKSGTTWLKALTFALVNRNLYPVAAEQHPLLTKNPHDLVSFLEVMYYGGQFPEFSSFTSPRLFGTHIPYVSLPKSVHTSTCKLIYLYRDPKDTFISLLHFSNKLRPQDMGSISLEDGFDMFCRGVTLCGPFWDHALSYWKQSLEKPDQVLFLNYEEMKEVPITQLKRLAEFLGCPFSIEEENSGLMGDILKLCSFDNLSNLEVNKNGKLSTDVANHTFFRRGEVGDWKNYLKPEMTDRLNSISECMFKSVV